MHPSGDDLSFDDAPGVYEMHSPDQVREFFGPPAKDTVDSDSLPMSQGSGAGPSVVSNERDVNLELKYTYTMRSPNRGCFFIFNHEYFDDKSLPTREGSRKDANYLRHTAKFLGFETVKVMDDLTRDEIMSFTKDCARDEQLSQFACFACAFLTHGGEQDVLYARDGKYYLKDITRQFGADFCRSLAGKPKLFFVQACRGTKLDHGAPLFSNVQSDAMGDCHDSYREDKSKNYVIPVEADFLIAHSTAEEYYSWRNTEYGTPFIQALCYCLQLYGGKHDLLQILTRVNRFVAFKYESRSEKKQIPSITSRLTAEVYFTD